METQTKHTPGPWIADGAFIETDQRIIARVGRHDSFTPEDKANARLIAAAPELLTWLKDAVDRGRQIGYVTDNSKPGWYDGAVKAIAKATGKE